MIFSKVINVLLLFFAKAIFTRELANGAARYNDDDDNVQHTFAKLLKSIVRVNEERLDAVKKISQLQDYMLTKNRLRTEDDVYDSLEEDNNGVYLTLGDPPKRRTVNVKVTRKACNKLLLNNNGLRVWRRQFIKHVCHDQSNDFCVKMCTKVVDNVCNHFNCNTKLNRDIRTECHDDCRSILAAEDE